MKLKIAIDGPSGAGKSSLAKMLAARLGLVYVDTGALYRSVGLYAKRSGVDDQSEAQVAPLLDKIDLSLVITDGEQHVIMNGEDVSRAIRENDISMYASHVSALPKVRAFLLGIQRDMIKSGGVIMDGRDIGTVIMPDADVKLFLTASPESRAMRRYKELREKGSAPSYDEILRDIIQRDENDRSRDIAPAVPADDAVILDDSDLDLDGTLDAAMKIIGEKCPGRV